LAGFESRSPSAISSTIDIVFLVSPSGDPQAAALDVPSRRNHALTWLRGEIVAGRLRPGDRLVEADLARRLGTSRAPVREALRQLEQEGLVTSRPYAITEVMGLTPGEVEEVLVPIRLTVERFAFSSALKELTDDDFEVLEGLITLMREAGRIDDADALAEADLRFHELVIERSGRPHCLQIWRTIEPRVRAYFRRDAPAHRTPDEVAAEHERLLEALRARDESAVLATLQEHILNYLEPDEVTASED
jgi:DNA-binding GntR family transcriptional regulator